MDVRFRKHWVVRHQRFVLSIVCISISRGLSAISTRKRPSWGTFPVPVRMLDHFTYKRTSQASSLTPRLHFSSIMPQPCRTDREICRPCLGVFLPLLTLFRIRRDGPNTQPRQVSARQHCRRGRDRRPGGAHREDDVHPIP